MLIKYLNNAAQAASNQPGPSTAYNLGSAVAGAQTFAAAGLLTTEGSEFRARDPDNDAAWEIFLGYLTTGSPDTLSRAVLRESSTGSKIDWATLAVTPVIEAVAPAGEQADLATTISGSPTILEIFLPSGADNDFCIQLRNIEVSVSSAVIVCQFYEAGAYVGGTSDYNYVIHGYHTNPGNYLVVAANATAIAVATGIGTETIDRLHMDLELKRPRSSSTLTALLGTSYHGQDSTNRMAVANIGGGRKAAADSSRIRFLLDTGVWTAGQWSIRRRKSWAAA